MHPGHFCDRRRGNFTFSSFGSASSSANYAPAFCQIEKSGKVGTSVASLALQKRKFHFSLWTNFFARDHLLGLTPFIPTCLRLAFIFLVVPTEHVYSGLGLGFLPVYVGTGDGSPHSKDRHSPICPTSSVSKLVERIVNSRLGPILESVSLVSCIHCGLRPKCSSVDHNRTSFRTDKYLASCWGDLPWISCRSRCRVSRVQPKIELVDKC
jgi:hypothetical protein